MDLRGRKRDPSTLCVINPKTEQGRRVYICSYLHRFSVSLYYRDIASRLVKADQRLRGIAAENGKEAITSFAIDASGLGNPICDLIQEKFEENGMYPTLQRVYITGGMSVTEGSGYNEFGVPKDQLMSGLAAALDSGTLYFSKQSKEINQLVTEMSDITINITDSGRNQYDDRGKGHLSDLVIATALAVWSANKDYSTGPVTWGYW